MENFQVIGKFVPRIDAKIKVEGTAVYLADLRLPGMLHGRLCRSPYPHARVAGVNIRKAERVPGVVRILTGRDVPYLYGRSVGDQPVIASERVRHVGDVVAAVAAETVEAAEEAVERIEVDYEMLPAVFDVEESLQTKAPIVHEHLESYWRQKLVNPVPGTNICSRLTLIHGDIDAGFRQSDMVVENRFRSPMVQHGYLESKGSIAQFDPSGRICVWTHNQSPYRLAEVLLRILKISYKDLRLIVPYIGGGFGGKTPVGLEPIAIELARACRNRPVSVILDREEEFIGSWGRVPAVVEIKSGLKKDGSIRARKVRVLWDNGAYAMAGPPICRNATVGASGPYDIPNVHIEGLCIYTNNIPSGAMRGFGIPQVTWAYESHSDIIAKELGMNPYEFRMINTYKDGAKSATGEKLRSVGLKKCLKAVADEFESHKTLAKTSRKSQKRYGKGWACTQKLMGSPSSSSAFVKIESDGTVVIMSSGIEMGQGAQTTLAMIASEVLGIPMANIRVNLPDSDFTPYDESTTSSKFTFHGGNAVRLAALDARKQILKIARKAFAVKSYNELEMSDGAVFVKKDPKSKKTIGSLLTSGHYGKLSNVVGRGAFFSDYARPLDPETSQSPRATACWMHAAHGAEVEVDEQTGAVRILRIIAAHDVGKALNPMGAQQQIEGGVLMGIGQAICEQMITEKGKVLNPSFKDYKIPTARDVPEITPRIVEVQHWKGPFGAKGLGEVPIAPTPAAIANAVSEAVGVRIFDLPLTAEKILRAIKEKSTD